MIKLSMEILSSTVITHLSNIFWTGLPEICLFAIYQTNTYPKVWCESKKKVTIFFFFNVSLYIGFSNNFSMPFPPPRKNQQTWTSMILFTKNSVTEFWKVGLHEISIILGYKQCSIREHCMAKGNLSRTA